MMKKLLTVCGLMCARTVNAQDAYDVLRVMESDLNGTARFVGMGGAMGALGGDISVMGTNPAGIGIYRRNDFSLSFGVNNTGAESNFNGSSMTEDRTKASFDQIGFVYSHKVGNETSLRFVNFGFNYHKSKDFNKIFSMGGMLNGFSQWLITTPCAPAALSPSGKISAIPLPGRSVSMYGAKTIKFLVFSTTLRISTAGQIKSTSISYFSAALSAAIAYSNNLSP